MIQEGNGHEYSHGSKWPTSEENCFLTLVGHLVLTAARGKERAPNSEQSLVVVQLLSRVQLFEQNLPGFQFFLLFLASEVSGR